LFVCVCGEGERKRGKIRVGLYRGLVQGGMGPLLERKQRGKRRRRRKRENKERRKGRTGKKKGKGKSKG